MANQNSPFGFRFLKMDHGLPMPGLVPVLLGSNVGCKPGDPIYIDANGKGQLCTTSFAPWGIAEETITAVATVMQTVQCIPALQDAVFLAQMIGTTAITQAFVGAKFDLTGSSGVSGLNPATKVAPLVLTNSPWLALRLHDVEGNSLGTYATFEVKAARSQYHGILGSV